MPDVSTFSLDGKSITVKDETARSTAQSASTTANQALQLAQEIEQLSHVTVSYEQQSENIIITTSTHEGG